MIPELQHHYGKNTHILDDHFLNSILTKLCQPQTVQPSIIHYTELLYIGLLNAVVAKEFPLTRVSVPTRMTEKHKNQLLHTQIVDPNHKVVCVSLARAGILPSQVCFENLNYILSPENVRQDFILASRLTDKAHRVVGTELQGIKIGGGIEETTVLIPDPMGATGTTIDATIDHYKKIIKGKAFKFIALHLILTPEYLARLSKSHPELIVYGIRLDRGLSPADVLQETPGKRWSEERGLDDNQYIVPGAGGLGEILNNSFV